MNIRFSKCCLLVILLHVASTHAMSWSQVAQNDLLRNAAQSPQESSLRVSSASSSSSSSTQIRKVTFNAKSVSFAPKSLSDSAPLIRERNKKKVEPPLRVSESLQKTLWYAARTGNCVVLEREFKKDPSLVNISTNGNNARLLHWASSFGHLEAVKLLVNSGASINECDGKGRNAVSFAASKSFRDIVKYLRSSRALFDQQDDEGKTILHWAVADMALVAYILDEEPTLLAVEDVAGKDALQWAAGAGYLETVKVLLARGALVDKRDKEGRTALWWAAAEGHKDVCEVLVRAGANIDAQDLKKQSVVSWAAHKNRVDVVRFLLDRNVNLRVRDAIGKEPLHWAVVYPELVRLLLDKKADPNALDSKKGSPLTWAAYYGALDSVVLLLSRGADPSLCDVNGKTAATLAAEAGHTDVVKALTATRKISKNDLIESFCRAAYAGNMPVVRNMLSDGMKINSHLSDGKTALSWASGNAQIAVVGFLLSQGALVNLADAKGQTPLSWAAHADCAQVVELLLEHGGDPCSKDETGKTPLHWAKGRHVAQLLLDAGAKVIDTDNEGKTALSWACYEGRSELVVYLLKRGASVNQRDHKGCFPLYWSVGHPAIVEILVNGYHADLSYSDSDGLNALHCAAALGNRQSARFLLKAGIDPECESNDKATALIKAVQRGDRGMVEELLNAKKSSSRRVTTSSELTALFYSLAHDDYPMYELLVSYGIDQTMHIEGGRTFLHVGAFTGNYRFVRDILRKRVFSVDERCIGKGRTAIQWAIRMCKGCVKKDGDQNPVTVTAAIIAELVSHGADVTLRNLEGMTAEECIELMRSYFSQNEKKLLLLALRYSSLSEPEKEEYHSLFRTLYAQERVAAMGVNSRDEALLNSLGEITAH